MYDCVNLQDLIGQKITAFVEEEGIDGDELHFTLESGKTFKMSHEQECCEYVRIEDICGDVDDLVDADIVHFEERTNSGEYDSCDTFTWTFYDIQTTKGCVNIRWLGESNGYYSESVEITYTEEKHNG